MENTVNLLLTLLLSCVLACSPKSKIETQPIAEASFTRSIPGASCEDCEYMFQGIPEIIISKDTTEGWTEPGQKLIVKGRVVAFDEKTPVKDVILYYYHTDQKGLYAPGQHSDAGSRKHGRLRGWVKSAADGTYAIYTSRPAQYPNNTIEAHIHTIVKEPDMNDPYWIDAWVFDDDPYLTPDMRRRLENRGGSGILKTRDENGIQIAEHDVILGKNIPGYPVNNRQ